ncbi:MAG: hypothetical protein ACRDJH_00795 [Thermomicrobiales bacterium]
MDMDMDMEDEAHQQDDTASAPQLTSRSRRDKRRLIVLAAVLAVAIAIIGIVAFGGDENDPASDQTGIPTQVAGLAQNIPPPERCRVTPRPVDRMQALMATPVASPVTDIRVASPGPAEGTPADAATIEDVVATYTEAIACQNAGNFARTYALYSDDFVRRILGGASVQLGVDPALVAVVIGTPTTVPPMEWTAIVARGAVEMLSDGRASAVFVTVKVQDAGNSDAARPRVVFFVKQDGRWLIDGTFDPAAEGTPAGSPVIGSVVGMG